jgi:hypothetical protein
MLILSSFLLIQEESVFRLYGSNFVIQPEKVVLEIFEFKQFLLERGNDCIFMLRLCLVQSSCVEVSEHFSLELGGNDYIIRAMFKIDDCFGNQTSLLSTLLTG